jgi:hypothetical protein
VKIEDIIKRQNEVKARDNLPPLQKKVLGFFERHKGEVFSYHDAEMLKGLPDKKASALGWAMWGLERKKLLAKIKVGRKTYFGLPADIKKLDAGLKQKG